MGSASSTPQPAQLAPEAAPPVEPAVGPTDLKVDTETQASAPNTEWPSSNNRYKEREERQIINTTGEYPETEKTEDATPLPETPRLLLS